MGLLDERLDFELDLVAKHFARQPINEFGRIFVDACRKVDRSRRQRRHVGLQEQHGAPLSPGARTAARGNLRDHSGAVLANSVQYLGEAFSVRRRRFVVVPDMQMDQRRACLECFVSRFDLLVDRDRNRRIVLLPREGPGDGNRDDGWRSHDDVERPFRVCVC